MKNLKQILIVLFSAFLLTTPVFAWGDKGHKTVGQIAYLYLDAPTKQKLAQIMKQGDTLANMSIWADKVKNRRFSLNATDSDLDTQAFLRNLRNKDNREWHFVNLPLDCTSLNSCAQFRDNLDIVKVINLSIRTLRGENVTTVGLNKRNALRMLIHLIGDMHQPLHVGCGFINEDGDGGNIVIETNPTRIISLQLKDESDLGGNKLLFNNDADKNLHSFWDGDLVYEASENQTVAQFAESLKNAATPAPSWSGTGDDFRRWAEQWALDSVAVSRQKVYSTVSIERPITNDENGQKYVINVPGNYGTKNRPVVKEQLVKSGFRLAQLLKAVL